MILTPDILDSYRKKPYPAFYGVVRGLRDIAILLKVDPEHAHRFCDYQNDTHVLNVNGMAMPMEYVYTLNFGHYSGTVEFGSREHFSVCFGGMPVYRFAGIHVTPGTGGGYIGDRCEMIKDCLTGELNYKRIMWDYWDLDRGYVGKTDFYRNCNKFRLTWMKLVNLETHSLSGTKVIKDVEIDNFVPKEEWVQGINFSAGSDFHTRTWYIFQRQDGTLCRKFSRLDCYVRKENGYLKAVLFNKEKT